MKQNLVPRKDKVFKPMPVTPKKSFSVSAVGWIVSLSNISLFVLYYSFLLSNQATPVPPKIISFLSLAAVFPQDFFTNYFSQDWPIHFYWIFIMTVCAFGILLLNRFARSVFITLNIIHVVILTFMALERQGQAGFLDFFFKLYFNAVAAGAYIGFLTLPEAREQFKISLERVKFKTWLEKSRLPVMVKTAPGYYNLGLAYSRIGRYEDAVLNFKKALELDSNNDAIYFSLGEMTLKQKNHSAAIQAFKDTVRINPVHFQATYNLGTLHQQAGCTKEAVYFYKRATHIQPDNAGVYRDLGKACNAMASYEEAQEAFRKAVGLNPQDGEAYFEWGRLLANHLNQNQQALEILRTASRLKPEDAEVHFQLGLVCQKVNRPKDALRAFKEVIRLDAQNKQAHYQLGFTYALLKDFESARREYRFLKDIDADMAEALRLLIEQ